MAMQPLVMQRPRTSDTVAEVEQKLQRNIAVDAYRGLVMLLMMAEVLQFSRVALSFPNSLIWRILAFNQTHSEWVGMSLHDTIQPSFTFLVGVALPYSVRSRLKKGATFQRLLIHTLWRSFLLVALGIFLTVDPGPYHLLHVRRHPDPDWPRLHVCLPAHIRSSALAVDCICSEYSSPIGWHGRCTRRLASISTTRPWE